MLVQSHIPARWHVTRRQHTFTAALTSNLAIQWRNIDSLPLVLLSVLFGVRGPISSFATTGQVGRLRYYLKHRAHTVRANSYIPDRPGGVLCRTFIFVKFRVVAGKSRTFGQAMTVYRPSLDWECYCTDP